RGNGRAGGGNPLTGTSGSRGRRGGASHGRTHGGLSTPGKPTSPGGRTGNSRSGNRSEEHTSELQSRENIVCRLLLEKKKTQRSVRMHTKSKITFSARTSHLLDEYPHEQD